MFLLSLAIVISVGLICNAAERIHRRHVEYKYSQAFVGTPKDR